MKFRMRRVAEASVGIASLAVAVSWLSGGCEQKIPAGRVSLPGATATTPGKRVAVTDRIAPSNEWASGEISSARRTAVSSRVVARIEEIRVTAGSRVEPGDVLVVLDARDLEARVGAAEETLRAAQARLELAQRDYARTRALLAQGVVSQSQLDQATSELESAQAAVKGLEEERQASRTTLSFAEIRAPVGGRVVDRLAEPGDTAMPGEPLLRIYDPSLLRVDVPVRESLAVRLRVGQTLEVEIPALDASVQGVVDEIVPFADPGARTLLVRVRLTSYGERVFAGMFARVSIPAGERRMLRVPAAAIEEIGQLSYVDVVAADGTLARHVVTTGRVDASGQVEILSGLQPSDAVWVPEAPGSSPAPHDRATDAEQGDGDEASPTPNARRAPG